MLANAPALQGCVSNQTSCMPSDACCYTVFETKRSPTVVSALAETTMRMLFTIPTEAKRNSLNLMRMLGYYILVTGLALFCKVHAQLSVEPPLLPPTTLCQVSPRMHKDQSPDKLQPGSTPPDFRYITMLPRCPTKDSTN